MLGARLGPITTYYVSIETKIFWKCRVLRLIFEFRALNTETWNGNIYTSDETFETTEDFMTNTGKDKSDDASSQLAACDVTAYIYISA